MNKVVLFLFVLFAVRGISAQEIVSDSVKSLEQYSITKLDGTEYLGSIISDDGREVLIESVQIGKLYLPKSEIKSIVKITDVKDIVRGEYQSEGPFTTRYSFTTNALPIKRGENYTMVNLYGPEVHFAVNNNLNIGLMSTWLISPLVLALKYSIKTKNSKINFSAGTLFGTTGYLNDFKGYGGVHWLCMTYGSRKKNVSFSGGYAYLKTGGAEDYVMPGVYSEGSQMYNTNLKPMFRGPIFSVAGIYQVGPKASFVFDSMFGFISHENISETSEVLTPGYYDANTNIYIPETVKYDIVKTNRVSTALFLMPGMRFQHSDTKAFQLSLVGVSVFGVDTFSFPFPMCSWFHKF